MTYWHSASLAKVRPRPRRMHVRLSRSLSKSTTRFPYLRYYCPTKPLLGLCGSSNKAASVAPRLEWIVASLTAAEVVLRITMAVRSLTDRRRAPRVLSKSGVPAGTSPVSGFRLETRLGEVEDGRASGLSRSGEFRPPRMGQFLAEQCPCSVDDEVRALLWNPVATALDDLKSQVGPVGFDSSSTATGM